MGKKKSEKQAHPTNSFSNLVADATISKLNEHVSDMISDGLGQLAKAVESENNRMFLRILTLESLLMDKIGLTTNDILDKHTDLEDLMQGLLKTEEAAKSGDKVRLSLSTKEDKEDSKFTEPNKVAINDLMGENPYPATINSALIGKKTGDEVNVTLEEGTNKLFVKMLVERVSTKKG